MVGLIKVSRATKWNPLPLHDHYDYLWRHSL